MKIFARPGKTNHLTPLHLTAGSLVAIAASTAFIGATPELEAVPAAKSAAEIPMAGCLLVPAAGRDLRVAVHHPAVLLYVLYLVHQLPPGLPRQRV